jgi:hypothetical protein
MQPRLLFRPTLPPSVDLRKQCPPPYDQGQLGSCTANAIGGAIEFDQIKASLTEFTPSRIFIYYNERTMEGTVNSDSGAQIRDGIKSVATLGAPPEKDWPYNIAKFTQKPPVAAFNDAKQHLVVLYQRLIQDLGTLKGCPASGFPFVFGFTCYESFESAAVAKSGILPMPASGETVVGGPCCALRGLRRQKPDVSCAELVGYKLGTERLFQDALCLPDRLEAGQRPVDHS